MALYARGDFERQRAALKQAERRVSLPLVVFSVGGGVAQLIFLRWADEHLARAPKDLIAVSAFLIYMAVVGYLLVRMIRSRGRFRPVCPQCGAALDDDSLRIAAATGRCDACGGQVIA